MSNHMNYRLNSPDCLSLLYKMFYIGKFRSSKLELLLLFFCFKSNIVNETILLQIKEELEKF